MGLLIKSGFEMKFYNWEVGRIMGARPKDRQPKKLGSAGPWLVLQRAGCQHAALWLSTLLNSDFWQAGWFQWK